MKKSLKALPLLAVAGLAFSAVTPVLAQEGSIGVVSREDGSGTRGAFVEIVGVVDEDDNDMEEDDIRSFKFRSLDSSRRLSFDRRRERRDDDDRDKGRRRGGFDSDRKSDKGGKWHDKGGKRFGKDNGGKRFDRENRRRDNGDFKKKGRRNYEED